MAKASGNNSELVKDIKARYAGGAVLSQGEFGAVVKGFRSQVEEALPAHLKKNADKYARQTITLFQQNPALQKCSAISIIAAVMTASSLGLDLTPQLGQCYIIPYQNNKKTGPGPRDWDKVWEAQFQIGYRGTIALAQRSGNVACLRADVVREKDHFKYSKGLHPTLEHEESLDEDRGNITHAYAIANFVNGGYCFEVWPVNKVIAHAKKFSKNYYKDEYSGNKKTGNKVENTNSVWHKDFESMAKKTLIMAIWKYLPVSTEIMLAGEQDGAVRTDLSDVKEEKDIIQLPIQSDYEGDEEASDGTIDSSFAATEPAGQISQLDSMRSAILDLTGTDGGLNLKPDERAAYIKSHTGKTLEELTEDECSALVARINAELDARD
jgi:recombination protein RecT